MAKRSRRSAGKDASRGAQRPTSAEKKLPRPKRPRAGTTTSALKRRGVGGVSDDPEVRKRQTAHLRPPWRPGQSGNPAGRPKGNRRTLGHDLKRMLRIRLNDAEIQRLGELLGIDPQELEDARYDKQELIAAMLVDRATSGALDFFHEVFDRLDPKPRRVEVDARVAAADAAGRIVPGMSPAEAGATYRSLIDATPVDAELVDGDDGVDRGTAAAPDLGDRS